MSDSVEYEPPKPMYDDTLLAFQRATAPSVRVTFDVDPLGPVNKIIRLWVGNRQVGPAKLYPIPGGAAVGIRHNSRPLMRLWSSDWSELHREEAVDAWEVTVNGKPVLSVPTSEARPKPAPVPRTPWHVRTWRGIWAERWTIPDRITKRLGYTRTSTIEETDW